MPTETGIFTEQEAKEGHLFSYRLAKFIGDLLPKQIPVFDYGCGPASYLRYLMDRDFKEVTGIEGTKEMEYEIPRSYIINRDLSEPLNLGLLAGNVISIETWEHIPREFEQTFIDNICEHVKDGGYLIISCAHEGQQGYGHVNCRPDWYVIEQITKRGFNHNIDLTTKVRKTIEGPVAYLRENLFVFQKPLT